MEWDPRFEPLLKDSFSQRQWIWYEHGRLISLSAMIRSFLGIPGNALLDADRYVTVDGCVPHDCTGNRGMLWIDTGGRRAVLIFAGINLVVSNTAPSMYHLWIFSSEKENWQHFPPSFLASLHRWLTTTGMDFDFHDRWVPYQFALVTVVGPNGIMNDIGPDILGLGPDRSHVNSGANK